MSPPAALIAYVESALGALPEVADWTALDAMTERLRSLVPMSTLEHPVIAARSLGAPGRAAWPGAAAIYCLQASIHLVDDMLDEDTDGLYRTLGEGATANVALALQAAGMMMVRDADVHRSRQARVLDRLAAMSLATAYGQALDLEASLDETGYWRIVEAKSTPLFGAALEIGALLGGAETRIASRFDVLGRALGMIIQIHDDLGDAMRRTAAADWQRPGANLPLLYALTADHPERARFARLCRRASADPLALEEAQNVLVRSGAVSYCCYQVLEWTDRAREVLAGLRIPHPEHLHGLLDHYLHPLVGLFGRAGVEVPDALILGAVPSAP